MTFIAWFQWSNGSGGLIAVVEEEKEVRRGGSEQDYSMGMLP